MIVHDMTKEQIIEALANYIPAYATYIPENKEDARKQFLEFVDRFPEYELPPKKGL